MAETTAIPNVPRETSSVDPDVPRETSAPTKRQKTGGRTQQPRSTDLGEPIENPEFFDLIAAIQPGEWREVYSAYLYRCEPYTDKKVSGKELFVKKYFESFDQQRVMEEEGSGKYLVILNQFNPVTRHGKAVHSHYFEILNPKYPPQIPLGEWLEDPRNKKWAWAKPLIEAAEAKRLREAQGVAGSQTMDQATSMFQAAVEAVQKLKPEESPEKQDSLAMMAIQIMKETMQKNDGTNVLDVVDKVISAIGANKPGGPDPLIQFLLANNEAAEKRAESERQFNRELLNKLSEANRPKGIEDELQGLAKIKEIAGSLFGRRNVESSGTDWGGVVTSLGSKVLDVAGIVAQAVILKSGAPPKPSPTLNVRPQLPENPSAVPTQTKEPTREEQIMSQLEAINATFGEMFDIVVPHLVDCFHKSDGIDFREWYIEEYGNFAYRQVRQFSMETLLGLVELRKRVAPPHVQQLLIQLTPQDKAVQFLQEFLSDEPADDEAPEEVPDDQPNDKTF